MNKVLKLILLSIVIIAILQFIYAKIFVSSSISEPAGLGLILLEALIYYYLGYICVKKLKLDSVDATRAAMVVGFLTGVTRVIIFYSAPPYSLFWGVDYGASLGKKPQCAYLFELGDSAIFMFVFISSLIRSVEGGVLGTLSNLWKEKAQIRKSMETILLPVFFLLLMFLFLFTMGTVHWDCPPFSNLQCSFPPGFTCITNKLSANNGRLTLQIGQGTGHQIRINGVVCTQNTSSDFSDKTFISYGYNKNITMESGSSATLATPEDVQRPWLSMICTDASGKPLSPTNIGGWYNGRLYINYTELDTDMTRIIVGAYSAKYED
ncbi:hypothetical protein H0N98_03655 [Candidatus Micrarchaeota archaeon]|nr:hypothetical protein [Candidatus Micrarchaeota archaeon]